MSEKYVIDESNINSAADRLKDGCVLTVGSFDGIHIGHRELLHRLTEMAHSAGLTSVAVTFLPGDKPKRSQGALASENTKIKLLHECGVDVTVELPYSLICSVSAADFVNDWILRRFNAKGVVCGSDFRFGSGREGDTVLLGELLKTKSIPFEVCGPVTEDGVVVSSTYIRSLLADGSIKKANKLLGRPFCFENTVIHGMRLAEGIGFPTVNQQYPPELCLPAFGVYAAMCDIGGKEYDAMLNIGVKPTVNYSGEPLCETHIFDFSGDLYGKTVRISFIEFIRSEQKFPTVSELAIQIKRDAARVKTVLEKEASK